MAVESIISLKNKFCVLFLYLIKYNYTKIKQIKSRQININQNNKKYIYEYFSKILLNFIFDKYIRDILI